MGLVRRALCAAVLTAIARPAAAQLIPIRVVPVAEAEQFAFFPSANFAMANASLALADWQLDPTRNPALASRLSRGMYFGGPTFFAVTNDAGSGQTFPLGAFTRIGRAVLGGALAVQEIAPAHPRQASGVIPLDALSSGPGPFAPLQPNETRSNRHALASATYTVGHGLSFGASGLWSDLNAMEGMELLFTGSSSVSQRGDRSEVRVGALKEWGRHSLEAVAVRTRQSMAYDVGYAQLFWNPATRVTELFSYQAASASTARTDALQLQYSMPLRDSTWRAGALATANVMRESGASIHEFLGIPRDPSHTRAFNVGAGISRVRGGTTMALDAIFEPAWRRATGPADTALAIGPEVNREESYFKFRNVVLRGGVGREFAMDRTNRVRIQAGTQLRSVQYDLEQHDYLRGTWRVRDNSWREWTHGAGANFIFRRFEFGYQLRILSGMGRFDVPPDGDISIAVDSFGPGIPGAFTSGVTLYPVRVTSHQMFLTVPVR